MKDPSQRLGSNGATEVQDHQLFKSIDWKRLEAGKMKPLFEPDVIVPFFFICFIFLTLFAKNAVFWNIYIHADGSLIPVYRFQ